MHVAQKSAPVRPAEMFRKVLATILKDRRAALGKVKGNFAVHVPGALTLTVVTAGPRLGIHEGMTDDALGFALCCPEEVLAAFLGESAIDLGPYVERGELMLEGDFSIFERFLALAASQSMLSVRLAG